MTEPHPQLLDYVLVRRLQAVVADTLSEEKQRREVSLEPELTGGNEEQYALSLITVTVAKHMQGLLVAGYEIPDPTYDQRLVSAIYAAMYGAGALQELLDDALVENIDINGCDEVWVTYADARGKVRGRPVAGTDEDLISIVQTLASYAGINARPFTPAHPELDLRLSDGSRLSAVMSASDCPIVSIRRNRYPQMFLTTVPAMARVPQGDEPEIRTLLELGTVDERLAQFLSAAVRSKCNLMIAGATDAGKTTLLRALINEIDVDVRLITIERALELGLKRHPELHADVVELEEVLPDSDGHGGLTIDALVRRTRRHNPKRVIVGEVLGPEVVQMLSAMSQGNNGSLSTIHARSAVDVLDKLATYAAQFESLSFDVTHALIASSLDFVIYITKNDMAGGRRCVTEVVELTGVSEGRVSRSWIFEPDPITGMATRAEDVAITRAKTLANFGYDDTTAGW